MLLKQGETVERTGTMATVFEDYSRLQIGATGHDRQRTFTVLGRIQLTYDAGYWSEWYIAFDDGNFGWLSDASGQFAITTRVDSTAPLPAFGSVYPGYTLDFDGQRYVLSDTRTAHCSGGEGELPFRIGDGWTARVADFRRLDRFITLDWSEVQDDDPASRPVVYLGQSVELDALGCVGLRETEAIRETAGQYRGELKAFSCPSCGAPLAAPAGVAEYVVCGSCHAGVDCTREQAVVFAVEQKMATVSTALAPGASATFDGRPYTVLGVMRCRTSTHSATWDEYLLHNIERGLMWLVQSEGSWERVDVLNAWPDITSEQRVVFEGKPFLEKGRYDAVVTYVAGAFNWRVSVGDTTSITDFMYRTHKLTRETTQHEIVWSRARPVPNIRMAERFGDPKLAGSNEASSATSRRGFFPLPWIASAILVVVNFGDLAGSLPSVLLLLLGIAALWIPEWIWLATVHHEPEDDDA
ncbi:DUF4178 domain-containing protein [Pararobbsia alpina]|uniref:DUF4178 domain-containing protein n=1 Tax=Pararobbsia alpina TaxID=621374 RepID=UPI0039A661BC